MKKQTLFLVAGGMLAFASCNNEGAGGYTDAQVDSMVNARVELIQAELEAQNDSLINARAYEIADSIIAASKGVTKTTSKSTKPTTSATPPKEEPKPATIGNGKPKIGDKKNQDDNTIGNGKPKIGDKKNQDDNSIGNGKPKIGK